MELIGEGYIYTDSHGNLVLLVRGRSKEHNQDAVMTQVAPADGEHPPSYNEVAGRSETPSNSFPTTGIGGVWFTPNGGGPPNPPPYTDTLPGYNDRFISPRDLQKYYRSQDLVRQRIRRQRDLATVRSRTANSKTIIIVFCVLTISLLIGLIIGLSFMLAERT